MSNRSINAQSDLFKSLRIEEIDQLLNELEELALSSASRQKFLSVLLDRTRFLLDAHGASVVIQAASGQWLTLCAVGDGVQETPIDVLNRAEGNEYTVDGCLLAVPIRKRRWSRGALVVALSNPTTPTQTQELAKLCDALAEILAQRQWSELESLLNDKWLSFQNSLKSIASSASIAEAAYLAVNDMAALSSADRVSIIVVNKAKEGRVQAISGVVQPNRKAAVVAAIQDCGTKCVSQGKPLSHHSGLAAQDASQTTGNASLLANHVCIPFSSQLSQTAIQLDRSLLLEWDDYERFVLGCTTLNYVFPAFVLTWQQLSRYQRFPRLFRALFARRQLQTSTGRDRGRRWITASLLALAAACLLNLPTDLRIETSGALQPVEQRAVFAALDGVVSRLLVEDGQTVVKGQPLVEMTSPSLEIDIQEVEGDIHANSEKRDGLNVAINQLTNDNPDALALQSKMSSEIRQLETQLENLSEKLRALSAERAKLQIHAPIDGMVVAREIERFLNARPVRRGDALLRVVNLKGPWRLELLVADRDSGYIKRKLFDPTSSAGGFVGSEVDASCQYVISSQPNQTHNAEVTWVSETARNPTGQGVYVDMHARVDSALGQTSHMGATVVGFVDCGRKPLWFVWSRPFIEALQRKHWL